MEVYDRHSRRINTDKDGFVPKKTGQVHEIGAGNDEITQEFRCADMFHLIGKHVYNHFTSYIQIIGYKNKVLVVGRVDIVMLVGK
jgi:hypothetical protein